MFSAEDEFILGGEGRDVGLAIGTNNISLNLTDQEFEILVGTSANDTFTFGDSAEVMMVAGGAGSDTMNVTYGDGQGTRILWGGDDNATDIFDFTFNGSEVGYGYQLGLLVATVTGLTAANFATFTLSMLNLPTNFNWDAIDVVILNPQAEDELRMWGSAIDASPYENEIWATVGFDEEGYEIFDAVYSYTSAGTVNGTSDFLGTPLHMQSQEDDGGETAWIRIGQNGNSSLIDGVEVSQHAVTDFIAARGSPDATWEVDLTGHIAGGNGTGMYWIDEAQGDGTPDAGDWWFVAGGEFDGNDLTAVNAPTAIMDPNAGAAVDWLLS